MSHLSVLTSQENQCRTPESPSSFSKDFTHEPKLPKKIQGHEEEKEESTDRSPKAPQGRY